VFAQAAVRSLQGRPARRGRRTGVCAMWNGWPPHSSPAAGSA
jgi:hypothetical protein